jgi:hypothetical protein
LEEVRARFHVVECRDCPDVLPIAIKAVGAHFQTLLNRRRNQMFAKSEPVCSRNISKSSCERKT